MKLALFDDYRVGVLADDTLVDVTDVLPWRHDTDPLTAGWWRRLCRDFTELSSDLRAAAANGTMLSLPTVRLHAPVLNPSKVIAAASNYAEHVTEMHSVQERILGHVESWMMDFDVFLKAPSSIVGPRDHIGLPADILAAGHEVHHECELVIVIGAGGKDIPPHAALDHVFGYTTGLDITVRSEGDRSRRKSYDTFSPVGPWVVTSDEAGDPHDFDIRLFLNGAQRQHVNTKDLLTGVPEIVSRASAVMTLLPGDLIFTGAPPGVGPIAPGDLLDTHVSRIGAMQIRVKG